MASGKKDMVSGRGVLWNMIRKRIVCKTTALRTGSELSELRTSCLKQFGRNR